MSLLNKDQKKVITDLTLTNLLDDKVMDREVGRIIDDTSNFHSSPIRYVAALKATPDNIAVSPVLNKELLVPATNEVYSVLNKIKNSVPGSDKLLTYLSIYGNISNNTKIVEDIKHIFQPNFDMLIADAQQVNFIVADHLKHYIKERLEADTEIEVKDDVVSITLNYKGFTASKDFNAFIERRYLSNTYTYCMFVDIMRQLKVAIEKKRSKYQK